LIAGLEAQVSRCSRFPAESEPCRGTATLDECFFIKLTFTNSGLMGSSVLLTSLMFLKDWFLAPATAAFFGASNSRLGDLLFFLSLLLLTALSTLALIILILVCHRLIKQKAAFINTAIVICCLGMVPLSALSPVLLPLVMRHHLDAKSFLTADYADYADGTGTPD
jgi:hypothetical protein